MPIINTNNYGSIYKRLPAKVIAGSATAIDPLESWMYNDGLGDPWWVGAAGTPCKWTITASINSMTHSSHLTRVPFSYTGLDITQGMWVASTSSFFALRINSITSLTDSSITFVAEDVDRYNTFNDPTGTGTGVFSTGSIIFFDLGDDGLPILNNMQIAMDAYIMEQLVSRFRVFNPSIQVPFFQINHGFNEGETLVLDPSTQTFRAATATDIFRAGTVTAVGPGPNYFYLAPLTKVITNLEPGLPGPVGGVVWLDPSTGDMSTTEGTSDSAIYIKMNEAQSSFTVSGTANPTATGASSFLLNEIQLDVGGTFNDTQTTSYIINLINSKTSEHGVTASMGSKPTVVTGTVGFPSTNANPNIVFTLNGISITVTSPSLMISQFTGATVGWWDFIKAINETTQKHGVYATFNPINGVVVLTNASGGSIDFVNVTPATSANGFSTITDACGFAVSTAPGPANYLFLERTDGGPIIITDYNTSGGVSNQLGSFVTNAAIPSVANGQLPLALVVDQSMYANANHVVPDVTSMNAITNMRVGDQVFVQSATNNQWATYVYTSTGWVKTGDQASANTDANDLDIIITPTSPTSQSIGVVSLNSRILNVTVNVTSPFTSDTVITVGTASNPTAIMDVSAIDLTTVGSYVVSSSFVYDSSQTDFNVDVYFTVGSAISGSAKVLVSYL